MTGHAKSDVRSRCITSNISDVNTDLNTDPAVALFDTANVTESKALE